MLARSTKVYKESGNVN